MRWSEIPWHPPKSTLRWFAGIWLVWFLGLGWLVWPIDEHHGAAIASIVCGLLVGLGGLAQPGAIRLVFACAMAASFPIGWLMSWLLLGIVYYCLFTPLGLFFRLIGRDALALRLRPDISSYWTPKSEPADIRQYFRQS